MSVRTFGSSTYPCLTGKRTNEDQKFINKKICKYSSIIQLSNSDGYLCLTLQPKSISFRLVIQLIIGCDSAFRLYTGLHGKSAWHKKGRLLCSSVLWQQSAKSTLQSQINNKKAKFKFSASNSQSNLKTFNTFSLAANYVKYSNTVCQTFVLTWCKLIDGSIKLDVFLERHSLFV